MPLRSRHVGLCKTCFVLSRIHREASRRGRAGARCEETTHHSFRGLQKMVPLRWIGRCAAVPGDCLAGTGTTPDVSVRHTGRWNRQSSRRFPVFFRVTVALSGTSKPPQRGCSCSKNRRTGRWKVPHKITLRGTFERPVHSRDAPTGDARSGGRGVGANEDCARGADTKKPATAVGRRPDCWKARTVIPRPGGPSGCSDASSSWHSQDRRPCRCAGRERRLQVRPW